MGYVIKVGNFVLHVDKQGLEQFDKALQELVDEGWADPRKDNKTIQ